MKLLAILTALPLLAAAEDLVWCGTARYYPSKYTCFDGNFLCPKDNGEALLKCGQACYSTRIYYCDANQKLQIYQPGPEPILDCGGQPYYPSKYACYDGNFLCPILNGAPTLRCGKACYLPTEYRCNNGVLSKPSEVQDDCLYRSLGQCYFDWGLGPCCEGYYCAGDKCRPMTPHMRE